MTINLNKAIKQMTDSEYITNDVKNEIEEKTTYLKIEPRVVVKKGRISHGPKKKLSIHEHVVIYCAKEWQDIICQLPILISTHGNTK